MSEPINFEANRESRLEEVEAQKQIATKWVKDYVEFITEHFSVIPGKTTTNSFEILVHQGSLDSDDQTVPDMVLRAAADMVADNLVDSGAKYRVDTSALEEEVPCIRIVKM